MAAAQAEDVNTTLTVKLLDPFVPEHSLLLKVGSNDAVGSLHSLVEQQHPLKPEAKLQKFVHAGRILTDTCLQQRFIDIRGVNVVSVLLTIFVKTAGVSLTTP